MTEDLDRYQVLSFDCYGTLIDWETGIWDALQPLLERNASDRITREMGLRAFAEQESRQQHETPTMLYPELLARVHAQIAGRFSLATNKALDLAFAESLGHWPAFADSAEALRVLKRHYKLVVLSNVHRAGFQLSRRKLGVAFDAVYTAEDIGSYKPAPRNFEYMLEHLRSDLDIVPEQILHTAQSLYHDHVPATRAGLARAWIDRQGLSDSENWGATAPVQSRPEVDFVFRSLGEMAAAVTSLSRTSAWRC